MGKSKNFDNVLQNAVFTPESTQGLIPIGMANIKAAKLQDAMTSDAILNLVKKKGMAVSEVSLRIFPPSKMGKTRRLDNTDLVAGYPFYGRGELGVKNLRQARSGLSKLAQYTLDRAEARNPVIYDMEFEDMRKLSVLRTTYYGRHLKPPIGEETNPAVVYPRDFLEILRRVVSLYVQHAPKLPVSPKAAMLEGTDAVGTALGAPSFAGDPALYHLYRMTTMRALPAPDLNSDGAAWLDAIEQKFAPLLSDGRLAYAAYLSYRQGAKIADIPLWYQTGAGFSAQWTAQGLYTFQRAVYPGSFPINVALTGLYKWMYGARSNILGLTHDPTRMGSYHS